MSCIEAYKKAYAIRLTIRHRNHEGRLCDTSRSKLACVAKAALDIVLYVGLLAPCFSVTTPFVLCGVCRMTFRKIFLTIILALSTVGFTVLPHCSLVLSSHYQTSHRCSRTQSLHSMLSI